MFPERYVVCVSCPEDASAHHGNLSLATVSAVYTPRFPPPAPWQMSCRGLCVITGMRCQIVLSLYLCRSSLRGGWGGGSPKPLPPIFSQFAPVNLNMAGLEPPQPCSTKAEPPLIVYVFPIVANQKRFHTDTKICVLEKMGNSGEQRGFDPGFLWPRHWQKAALTSLAWKSLSSPTVVHLCGAALLEPGESQLRVLTPCRALRPITEVVQISVTSKPSRPSAFWGTVMSAVDSRVPGQQPAVTPPCTLCASVSTIVVL